MTRRLLLGLDWGGGGGRAVLFDPERGTVRAARRRWRAEPLTGTGGLGWTYDLESAALGFRDTIADVLRAEGADAADLAAVGVSAVRFGQVLVGPDGLPRDVSASRDARAAGEALRLLADAPRLHAATGHWPLPLLATARLQRLADALDGARAIALNDWLAYALSGALATDPSQASATGLFDVGARDWADAERERLGIPEAVLPPVAPTGSRLGVVEAGAAERFGLPPGLPVAVGGSDSACALLGVGAGQAGERLVVSGTTAPVLAVADRARVDPRLFTELHVLSGRWMLDSNSGAIGEALEWIATLLFPGARAPVAQLLGAAADSEPGARGTGVSVGGQVLDAREMHLPTASLRFSPVVHPSGDATRADLARAAIEDALFVWRANLEQLDEIAGAPAGPLRWTGGLSRSDFLGQLLADVVGRPVEVAASLDASAVGAALAAGVAAGRYADLDEALHAAPPPRATLEPEPHRSARYAELYAAWRDDRPAGTALAAATERRALGELLGGDGAEPAAAGSARRPRILATCDLDAEGARALGRIGPTEHASYRERGRLLTGATLEAALEGHEVFVTEIDLVDAAVVAARPELRVVAACRGDAVNVDVEACTAHGVPVLHTPGRNAEAVADLAVAFLLMLARQIPAADAFLRDETVGAGDMGKMGQAFTRFRGRELGALTVGLVGFGAVGRAVARRLAAFGTDVRVFDPLLAAERIAAAGATPLPLGALLESCDAISLHAPVTDSTRGLIGAAELARMPAGAVLVNTARAALVDEEALAAALESGALAGAALDVFSVEPPGADHPLLQLPGVIGTPHLGGNTAEVAGHQGRIVAEDLARLLRGERPHFVLNPEVLGDFRWDAPRHRPSAARLAELAERPPPAVSDLQRDESRPRPQADRTDPAGLLPAATRRKMAEILAGFVAAARDSDVLREHAQRTDVTLHFRLPDVGEEFHLTLAGGAVSGAVEPPGAPAEVELKLAADVLDGMFTGRINAMQSAMDGKLSFTGDTAKAMTLQDLQGELSRCYRAARDAAGDPGELAFEAAPRASAAVADDDVRLEIVRTVNELYAQELITATGGNVSAREPGGDRIWITPSQLFKGDLRPEVLVPLALDGTPLDPDARAPSSERKIHCAIYAARPEANAVIHSHAPHATILANTDLPFLPISTEAAFFGNIPRIPFIMPGTEALAEAVGAAAREEWAVLMKNHGLIVAGRSLRRAADMSEIIERTAEVILGCYAVGREPPVLPDEAVETLRKMGDLVA